MNRFKLIATNLLTALVTAVLTSLFWIAAYGGGETKEESRPAPSAEPGQRAVVTGGLVVGPSGLAIPVQGVRSDQLVDTYSQARASGERVHDAIDIMAPHGTPVVAAAPGTVEKLFFSEGGGGITAYVRSDDKRWIYYYAHLQDYAPSLREGQRVARGTLIGHVGSTGNANPAGPHLHFAIHRMKPEDDWHEGTAINPYPLLAGNSASR